MPFYSLRYMQLNDIPQVVELDKLSFPLPWSARSYAFEISDNSSSHMVTLEVTTDPDNPGEELYAPNTIVGYGGFWLIEGESHISTIAVHPDYRSQGLGEVLLAGMLGRSIQLNAEYSVLEVRVTNSNALNLYRKYEFEIVGRRKNYYRDNSEDAFQMHLSPLNESYRFRYNLRVDKLKERVSYINLLTAHPGKPAAT
jgi:[ribosomal protein S18]-alanine N-acetyltransferase